MENASKALIIAGAILISILLISLGIIMFNSSKGTTDQAKEAGELIEAETQKINTSIKSELAQKITFTLEKQENGVAVERINIIAEAGMTWEEFINSPYNTYGFTIGGGQDKYVTFKHKIYLPVKEKIEKIQKLDMKIIQERVYYVDLKE